MDHRADLPATPPWRSAAFIAVSVATVELLILLVVGIWLFGKFFSDEVAKATDPTTVARVAVERELNERGQLPQKTEANAKPESAHGRFPSASIARSISSGRQPRVQTCTKPRQTSVSSRSA